MAEKEAAELRAKELAAIELRAKKLKEEEEKLEKEHAEKEKLLKTNKSMIKQTNDQVSYELFKGKIFQKNLQCKSFSEFLTKNA